MQRNQVWGHVFAFITIVIWGTTFVSTKVLLQVFTPLELLLYRFVIAVLIMIIIYPKQFKVLPWKEELLFCFLGISGISFYFWTENIALQYTQASNVGLILSALPIFTVLLTYFTTKDEQVSFRFIVGFVLATIGIVLIMYNGKILKLNPLGDFMAVLSALLFSIYSILVKKVNKAYNPFYVVRKTFFYGVLTTNTDSILYPAFSPSLSVSHE